MNVDIKYEIRERRIIRLKIKAEFKRRRRE